ncbi:Pirin (plasmid) [Rhodovastum atsumiense]|uniref:Pirin n=1 Tax=Rhodovastum atsumiense TaxID=504468 RepID=A0A5M6IU90_9PROT|nr:replication protein RepA [Rhodovastum atsumiense]KAA5611791.1 pirin [Rhodovastum atsumiense]CAH2606102.1 Pirin [Rhodovastum atsumiense]
MSASDTSEVPRLVLEQGREKAVATLKAQGRHKEAKLVRISADVLADERGRLGISYSGFCLASLPHKALPEGQAWRRDGHQVTLLVEPGRMVIDGETREFGVPYGARARLIVIFLMSEAIKTRSREVHLGGNMNRWMKRMGMSIGGEQAAAVRDQAMRLSACNLKFFWKAEEGRATAFQRAAIIKRGLSFHRSEDSWQDTVVLDEDFYAALREHPVPLLEEAVKALRDRSMGLDVYVWLAYRLHALSGPTDVSWRALFDQFGAGFGKLSHWKPRFIDSFSAAMAAYPEARVDVAEDGLILKPSKPPVSPKVLTLPSQLL